VDLEIRPFARKEEMIADSDRNWHWHWDGSQKSIGSMIKIWSWQILAWRGFMLPKGNDPKGISGTHQLRTQPTLY